MFLKIQSEPNSTKIRFSVAKSKTDIGKRWDFQWQRVRLTLVKGGTFSGKETNSFKGWD